MLKKLTLILSLSIFFFTSAFADGLQAVRGKIPNGYNFWLYTPSVSQLENPGEPQPLIIFLHGRSLCGNDLNRVKRYGTINAIEKGQEIDAYVVAPQNPGESWKPSKVMDVVDYVCSNYNIDENRIYVLGMSLGGYGAIDLAATYPDRVAAAIGMCGGASVKDLSGLSQTPLWIIHGTADSAVPVSQSDKVAAAVKAAQADGINRLKYDRVPGMNHSRPARVFYRSDVYDWLMSHSLDDPDRPMNPTIKVNDDFFNGAYGGLKNSRGRVQTKPGLKSQSDSEYQPTQLEIEIPQLRLH